MSKTDLAGKFKWNADFGSGVRTVNREKREEKVVSVAQMKSFPSVHVATEFVFQSGNTKSLGCLSVV